ncbi:MAG TPA: hypothetical protein VJB59_06260 [Bdellovibrionota bacterium]|nr:hypothetical protein [Bdellovibrionota bacterium]
MLLGWKSLSILILAFLTAALTLLAGCAKELQTCTNVAKDQRASFMAPLVRYPVYIIPDKGTSSSDGFTEAEIGYIAGTVREWNTVGQKLFGHDLFRLGPPGAVPEGLRNGDPHDCKQSIGDQTRFYVVRETETDRWKALGFNASIPGATIRCSAGAELSQQVIYLNPKLVDSNQFSSVVLHELGHAAGLDHSCMSGAGKPDYVGCDKIKPGHPYQLAVMFPSLTRGNESVHPEIKDTLKPNDSERTQCLYNPQQ